MPWHDPKPAEEAEIVWLDESAKACPFLRESTTDLRGRTAPPTKRHIKQVGVVAYATLKDGTGYGMDGRYLRRTWSTLPRDRGYIGADGLVDHAPCEGVVPASIKPNARSEDAGDALRAHPIPWPNPPAKGRPSQ